jgi:hypothetical protein
VGPCRCFFSPRAGLRRRSPRRQALQELFAQSIETTIGHDQQQIAGKGFRKEEVGNGVGVREDAGLFPKLADRGSHGFGVQALAIGEQPGAMNAAEDGVVA